MCVLIAFRSSAAIRSESSSDADTALAHSSLILFSLAASITAQSMPRGNPRWISGLYLKSLFRNPGESYCGSRAP